MNIEQKGGSNGMKFSAWVKKFIGKKTNYDGVYGVQCVDLIDCYIHECLGLNKGFGAMRSIGGLIVNHLRGSKRILFL